MHLGVDQQMIEGKNTTIDKKRPICFEQHLYQTFNPAFTLVGGMVEVKQVMAGGDAATDILPA